MGQNYNVIPSQKFVSTLANSKDLDDNVFIWVFTGKVPIYGSPIQNNESIILEDHGGSVVECLN